MCSMPDSTAVGNTEITNSNFVLSSFCLLMIPFKSALRWHWFDFLHKVRAPFRIANHNCAHTKRLAHICRRPLEKSKFRGAAAAQTKTNWMPYKLQKWTKRKSHERSHRESIEMLMRCFSRESEEIYENVTRSVKSGGWGGVRGRSLHYRWRTYRHVLVQTMLPIVRSID